jgi:glutamine synthetase
MITDANPLEKDPPSGFGSRQTVEFRCPDGSADIYLLFAGLTVAARHGLEMENGLEFAEKTYVDVNIFEDKYKSKVSTLKQLPLSCWDSAEALEKQRHIFEEHNIFPPMLLDGLIRYLKRFNDKNLRESIKGNEKEIQKLVNQYLHCG